MASVTRLEFAQRLLRDLGAPTCQNNLQALVAWMRAEGTRAAWNPLATTLRWPGSTDFNSAGVQNYASLDDGVHATSNTLFLRYYDGIRAALARCAPPWETAHEVAVSRWGTGPLVEQVLPSVLASWPRDGEALVSGPPYASVPPSGGGGGVVATVGDWIGDGVRFVEGAIGAFVRVVLSPVVDLVRAAVRKLLEFLNATFHFIGGLFNKAIETIWHAIDALGRSINNLAQSVFNAINHLWSDTVKWVADRLHEFGDWVKTHLVDPIWSFILQWRDKFIAAAMWVVHFGEKVAAFILRFADEVANFFIHVARWLWDFAIGVGRWLKDFALGVGQVLVHAFLEFGHTVWRFVRDNLPKLVWLLGPLWGAVFWFFKDAFHFFRFLWDKRDTIRRLLTDPVGWFFESGEKLLSTSRKWFAAHVQQAFEENMDRLEDWLLRWWGEKPSWGGGTRLVE